MSQMKEQIETAIKAAFPEANIELVDNSAAHSGHAGQREHGGGHFALKIVSSAFEGMNRVQRHQAIYKVLDDHFSSNDIHALQIQAFLPDEG